MLPALAATLISFVTPILLQKVDELFKGKEKSGNDKISFLMGVVRQSIETMMNGNVPLPDGTKLPTDFKISDDAIKAFLEGIVQAHKATLANTAGTGSTATIVSTPALVTPPVPAAKVISGTNVVTLDNMQEGVFVCVGQLTKINTKG